MTKKYDLIERTGKIGLNAIILCRKINLSPIVIPLISQFIRSTTSIGANYCEATEASSKKDFSCKIAIAKKEAKETLHWIKMLKTAVPELSEELNKIADEVQQIILIFSASINTANNHLRK